MHKDTIEECIALGGVLNDVSLESLADTESLAKTCASYMKSGRVLLLNGEMGVGKTTFAKYVIRAICMQDFDVPSPTFSLVNVYEGSSRIWHFDLYRLNNMNELCEIGFYEALNDIALIEWANKIAYPYKNYIKIALYSVKNDTHKIANIESDFPEMSR